MDNALVVYFVLLLLLVFDITESQSGWFVVSEDKCQFTSNKEKVINFSDNPSLFVNNIKTIDIGECRSSCCNHDTCNGYVWDASDKLENCKLLKCSSQGVDCKKALIEKNDVQSNVEVGFITGINDNPETTTTTTSTTTTVKPQSVAGDSGSSWLKQKLGVAPSADATKKKGTNLIETNKASDIGNALKFQKSDQVQPTTTTTTTSTKKSVKPPLKDNIVLNNDATTLSAVDEKHSAHTNTVSLSVAFVFGICFLTAVMVMLGRRWLEGLRASHKRGYTRISYLLNGV